MSDKDERKGRLAAALRANLGKRRAQRRDRTAAGGESADREEAKAEKPAARDRPPGAADGAAPARGEPDDPDDPDDPDPTDR